MKSDKSKRINEDKMSPLAALDITDDLILNQNESKALALSLSNRDYRDISLSYLTQVIGLRKTFFLEESMATRLGPGGPVHAPKKVCSYLVDLRGKIMLTDKIIYNNGQIIKCHYSRRKKVKKLLNRW